MCTSFCLFMVQVFQMYWEWCHILKLEWSFSKQTFWNNNNNKNLFIKESLSTIVCLPFSCPLTSLSRQVVDIPKERFPRGFFFSDNLFSDVYPIKGANYSFASRWCNTWHTLEGVQKTLVMSFDDLLRRGQCEVPVNRCQSSDIQTSTTHIHANMKAFLSPSP